MVGIFCVNMRGNGTGALHGTHIFASLSWNGPVTLLVTT